MERDELAQAVEKETVVELSLINGRFYKGTILWISKPNKDGDSLVYFHDERNNVTKRFRMSRIVDYSFANSSENLGGGKLTFFHDNINNSTKSSSLPSHAKLKRGDTNESNKQSNSKV